MRLTRKQVKKWGREPKRKRDEDNRGRVRSGGRGRDEGEEDDEKMEGGVRRRRGEVRRGGRHVREKGDLRTARVVNSLSRFRPQS